MLAPSECILMPLLLLRSCTLTALNYSSSAVAHPTVLSGGVNGCNLSEDNCLWHTDYLHYHILYYTTSNLLKHQHCCCAHPPPSALPSNPTAIPHPKAEVIGCHLLPLQFIMTKTPVPPLSCCHLPAPSPITVRNSMQAMGAAHALLLYYNTAISDLQQLTLLWVQKAQNLHFSLSGEKNHELLKSPELTLNLSRILLETP